jgi:DNA adenine methylase
MNELKPFDTYSGGKAADGVYQTIINYIAPHDVFVSGFLGNCAIMRYKIPAQVNVGIDLDAEVIQRWEQQNNSPLASTTSVFHQNSQLDLFQMDFFEYAQMYMDVWDYNDCLIYLDPPPYLKDTRKDSHSDIYNCEMSAPDHVRLLDLSNSMKAKVIISCYDNALYREKLKGWHRINFKGKSRRGPTTETIYLNYKPDGRLHDYRYTGSDFIDRQRIRRKVERHISKLKRLPEMERNAILSEMQKTF